LAVLATLVVLGGCGGRASGILGGGSGTNEGGSSGNVTGTPEGSTSEMQPETSVADSPAGTKSEASNGNPFTVTDAGAGSVDSTAGLEASALIDAADASETEADVIVPCGPPTAGTLFVDPSAGHDDDGGTGSQACPFRSLTHALSLVGDAGAPTTIEIVNTGAAPTLSQSTGEVFPITVPGGVTILAEDTTKNTPTVEVSVTANVAVVDPCFSAKIAGFCLTKPNVSLSHLSVSPSSLPPGFSYGILILNPGGAVNVDHVTIENFDSDGIYVLGAAPASAVNLNLTVGPGFTAHGNGSAGLHVYSGTATIVGGAGAEHTSFTQNRFGIWAENTGAVNVQGAAIDPANPDVNDVDVDDNSGNGLLLNGDFAGVNLPTVSRVMGLHVKGNGSSGSDEWGAGIVGLGPLVLRGSYVANNGAGIIVDKGQNGAADVDLGNQVGPDYGRNAFVSNTSWAICNQSRLLLPAAGNIFGTVDCSVGGKLDPALLGPQADPIDCGDMTSVNVANCTF
jgi:uncharacterized protein DUF1565